MIGQLLDASNALVLLAISVMIFGFAPGLMLSLVVRLIPDTDRRRELQAELYEVPRWERPYWVFEQLEVALRVGTFPSIEWWWQRNVWNRAVMESGVERNAEYPDSFWIPADAEKAALRPGDLVKLMWGTTRLWGRRQAAGERMWVLITGRNGDRFTGTINNFPVMTFLYTDEPVKFHADHIIDIITQEEIEAEAEAA